MTSIDAATVKRAVSDLGLDLERLGVSEAALVDGVNRELNKLGLVGDPRKDQVRSAVRQVLRDLIAEQRRPAAVSAREEFESEVADGVDEESLREHEVAERVLAVEGTEVTTESYIDAVDRVRAARA